MVLGHMQKWQRKHYGFDTYETAFGTTEENEVNILKREDWVLQ